MTIAATALGGSQGGMLAHSAGYTQIVNPKYLKAVFDPMRALNTVVFYKFFFGSIFLFCTIEADKLSDGDILNVAHTFDECLLDARQFASERYVFLAWKEQAGIISGRIMFIFQDSAKAKHFRDTLQKKCCTSHWGKKTDCIAIAADIAGQQVFTHGLLKLFTTWGDDNYTKCLFPAA